MSLGTIIVAGMVCGTLTTIAFFVTASLPKSPLKDWAGSLIFIMGCLLYTICPIDLMPELVLGPVGIFDDLGALFMAGLTAKKLMSGKPEAVEA